MSQKFSRNFDLIIIGSGVGGSFVAQEMSNTDLKILVLEAGKDFNKFTYPRHEIDANSQLYWSGGIEFNKQVNIGLLRPKVVGGGSIVNQALVDRFDDDALHSWSQVSGISFFNQNDMAPYYQKAEDNLALQEIPAQFRNGNAQVFQVGFEKNGHTCAPLRRAQKDCQYEKGNDCIMCLAGCPLESKQSMPVTTLKRAKENGVELLSDFEVTHITKEKSDIKINGLYQNKDQMSFDCKKVVLAGGAIGNSKLLLNSNFKKNLPALGKNFYTHPQFMNLGLYEKEINAHKGPFQSMKSADPNFRKQGFKLENVFAPPVGISMLIPDMGKKHLSLMKKIRHMACIEVAIRDVNPGTISVNNKGRAIVDKKLGPEDQKRRDAGLKTINQIFESTGAYKIIKGSLPIGLHLMGGCAIGNNPKDSVVNPDFQLHTDQNIYVCDSSLFPNAPGINPSLTIMALALKTSESLKRNWS